MTKRPPLAPLSAALLLLCLSISLTPFLVSGNVIISNDETATTTTIIPIAIVSCGASRAQEALTSMRSALLTTRTPLHFYIFHDANDGNDVYFNKALDKWSQQLDKQQQQRQTPLFNYTILTSNLPDTYSNLFAPCACQRLFLHEALPESVSHVLYMDSDTLVLQDLSGTWNDFLIATTATATASSPVMAAMVPEHEATAAASAYYRDITHHPAFQTATAIGLNSGVLLLDLQKLRQNPWNGAFAKYLADYELKFFDQDLLNIYFYYHPDQLQVLSCHYNLRPDHCFFSTQHCELSSDDNDNDSSTGNIAILHGNRGSFHAPATDQAAEYSVLSFQTLYKAFSLFPATDLGSLQAVQQAWQWMFQPTELTNYCDVTLPPVVTLQLERAAAAAAAESHKGDVAKQEL